MRKKITICGSMQFALEMVQLQTQLEELGYIVFLPDLSEASEVCLSTEELLIQKRQYIFQHFQKIQQSDAILIANYEKNGIAGYVGSNTLMEIAVAHVFEKEIYALHAFGEQSCSQEVLALVSNILYGKLSGLK